MLSIKKIMIVSFSFLDMQVKRKKKEAAANAKILEAEKRNKVTRVL